MLQKMKKKFGPFEGAPVRPNMLNMPKSACACGRFSWLYLSASERSADIWHRIVSAAALTAISLYNQHRTRDIYRLLFCTLW